MHKSIIIYNSKYDLDISRLFIHKRNYTDLGRQ
jgi:hypothetical protein